MVCRLMPMGLQMMCLRELLLKAAATSQTKDLHPEPHHQRHYTQSIMKVRITSHQQAGGEHQSVGWREFRNQTEF
jgi:hypothetical protein